MIRIALTAIALSFASSARAESANAVTLIYVDQSEACGYGKIAGMKRAETLRKAERVKRDIEKKGGSAKIVRLMYGMNISHGPNVAIIDTRC